MVKSVRQYCTKMLTLIRHVQISVDGFPIDQEIDVGVDFVTPAKPGGYVSYWRLASPTGQMFGQRVWVFIQVCSTIDCFFVLIGFGTSFVI